MSHLIQPKLRAGEWITIAATDGIAPVERMERVKVLASYNEVSAIVVWNPFLIHDNGFVVIEPHNIIARIEHERSSNESDRPAVPVVRTGRAPDRPTC